MKAITFLILVFSFSRVAQAQQLLTKNQQDVQHTVINFFEALSNRDSINLRNYCTVDILLLEYGQVWNLDTLIRKAIQLNTASDFKRVNSLDFITSYVDNKTAWTTYNLHSEIIRDGKKTTIQWLETIVAVKVKDRWKISVLHSTRIK
ncbi:MAG: nuclear transport factor 2 family protein [Flammeovirgaceae bacterium]|nr:nuclear transport factor 2 family protein [Flammeovirgaceae bacterium]